MNERDGNIAMETRLLSIVSRMREAAVEVTTIIAIRNPGLQKVRLIYGDHI